jgi:hypothetical protein
VILTVEHLAKSALDLVQHACFLGGEEADGATLGTGTGRTADAVDIVLGGVRHVVVDDVRDLVNVDAASDNVGGDEHAGVATLEAVERPLALRLATVAVNSGRRDARLLQNAMHAVGTVLGAREDEHTVKVSALEQLNEQVSLLHLVDRVDRLDDLLGRLGRRRSLDVHGILQRRASDAHNIRGHGGREEQVLTLFGNKRDDALHIGPETHVKHAVGLIEDEDLHAFEVQ